jgi:tetratricopeptide (TPR) repeat protein
MHRTHPLIGAILVGTLLAAPPAASQEPELPLPGVVEAVSLLGDSLRRPALDPGTEARLLAQLREADSAWAANPGDVDAIIWAGRRTAYLGRFLESIGVFSMGLTRHPDDARFYRHRGHRYITTRQLDRAIADLAYAARLTRGDPDEVEPDGMPNAQNIPTSTLQSNIWYHLGLAYYLKGDFRNALAAYRRNLEVARNPDMQVAVRHWLYMTLRRMGRTTEAREVLVPVTRDMEIIENDAYHRLLLFYKGELPADSLAPGDDDGVQDATVGYGLGNWHLYNGRRDEAMTIFRRITTGASWAAFGYLAAEAELAREGRGR